MDTFKHSQSFPKRILTGLLAVFSLAVTAILLLAIAVSGGASQSTAVRQEKIDVVGRFFTDSNNAISDATSSVMKIEKRYWISADPKSTPKPNKDCYGHTNDPSQLDEIIAAAEKLLDGQSLFFSTDAALAEDTEVLYYLDETILVITWKQPIDNTVYTFSEIKIADPSQFRRYLSGGSYGSGKLVYPTDMAHSVNAIVASSGDYYQFRNNGVIVYEGEVCRVNGGADTCYVDRNGDLHFTYLKDKLNESSARAFVEEHDIQFSLAFGPVLVENGELVTLGAYPLGEISRPFARAALCQMGQLHYLLVNANAEGDKASYTTMGRFAQRVFETGCQQAYALDGGQTAALVMDDVLINRVTKGYQRKISDIIYFATAIPNAE